MDERLTVIHNREMETLDIWFDDPEKEEVSEETGEGLILKKDAHGKIIGVEVLYFTKEEIPMELRSLPRLATARDK